MRNNVRQSYIFIILILIGYAIRLYKLGDQSLWYDETVSAFLANLSPTELIAHTARDIHPPGYYLLLQYWAALVGNTEFALAYFSVIFGMLIIPLTYVLATTLTNKSIGLWSALLVALSPFNVWYAQEVRMYTLGAALGLIALYFLFKALQLSLFQNWIYWSGYIIAAAIGLYTLYYFAFLLVVVNLLILVSIFQQPRLLRSLFFANGVALLLYLPWIPIAWRQATNPPVPPWRSPPQFWDIMVESWSALSLGQSVEPGAVWPVLIAIFILMLFGIRYLWLRHRHFHSLLLIVYVFGPLLLIYLLSTITPLYHVRYIFTYSPTFYILLGAGFYWLATRTRPWLAYVTLCLFVAVSIFSIYQLHFNPRYRADDYRAAVDFIMQRWQPDDVILINAGYVYTTFDYYANTQDLRRQRLVAYQPSQSSNGLLLLQTGTVDGPAQLGWNDPQSDFYAMSSIDTIAALEQLSTSFSRVWMLRAYDTVTDPNSLIRTWFAENTVPLEDQLFSGETNIRAQAFLLPHQSPENPQSIPFEDGMALAGWVLPQQSVVAGQSLRLKLWWATSATPSIDYKMSLKLWHPDGQLAAQGKDEWPVAGLYQSTDWPIDEPVYHPAHVPIPSDLPPGQYWLNVELYHPETLQPLPRQDNGEPFVTLGSIIVK